jgi:serine/threonine-protein kinase
MAGLSALVVLLVVGGIALGASMGGSDPQPVTSASTVPAETAVVTPPTPTPTPPSIPIPAEPVPVAAPVPGTAIVLVDVREAMVRIGDREITTADAEAGIELPPGHYDVHAEAEGHRPFDGTIDVTSGAEARLTVSLPVRRVVAPGTLSINTRPWSKVYVGGRLLGTTPIGEASVPSGSVRLRIVDRDGRTFSRTVDVGAGASESVFYDLDH